MNRQTWTDRVTRLRAALNETTSPTALALSAELAACGVDWAGRYRCRSPACGWCRRTYIRQQQRAALAWADGLSNADLAFASIVASGTSDLDALGSHVKALGKGMRNRLDAERRGDPDRWGGVRVMGWAEIDAIAADHLPLLGSSRRTLLPQIAPLSTDSTDPVWIATAHSLIDLGGVSLAEANDTLARQWPVPGQVDVQPLDAARPVEENLERLVGYSNKHQCGITIGAITQPWPMPWQAKIFSALAERRNAFEFLRFGIGSSITPDSGTNVPQDIAEEGDVLPFAYSVSSFPMYYITGRWFYVSPNRCSDERIRHRPKAQGRREFHRR